MKTILEQALDAELGSYVVALNDSDGPYALTKNKKYKILWVFPLFSGKNDEKELCNVQFGITDDLDQVSDVPYSVFHGYS